MEYHYAAPLGQVGFRNRDVLTNRVSFVIELPSQIELTLQNELAFHTPLSQPGAFTSTATRLLSSPLSNPSSTCPIRIKSSLPELAYSPEAAPPVLRPCLP